jgi:hypothetical protein
MIKHSNSGPGLGMWTSGTNRILPERWIWTGDRDYDFIWEADFYHNYTYPGENTPTYDNDQCLEAFADIPNERIALDHDDCDSPKPFICDTRSKVIYNYVCRNGVFLH